MDGYEKIVRSLMSDVTSEQRDQFLEAIRATRDPDHPLGVKSQNAGATVTTRRPSNLVRQVP